MMETSRTYVISQKKYIEEWGSERGLWGGGGLIK